MKRLLCAAALTALLASGCSPHRSLPGEAGVSIHFVVPEASKGDAVNPGDDTVNDISVFLYRDGLLFDEVRNDGPEAQLTLEKGRTVSIYALANMSSVQAPLNESDLDTLRYRIASVSELSGGLPMVFCGPSALTPQSDCDITLELTRLVSKWTVSVKTDMSMSSLIVRSLHLRQAALDVTPFAPDSKAQKVGDGDYEFALYGSNNRSFTVYALENVRGVLLADNESPSSKTRENIEPASEADLCTYLELKADWWQTGVKGELNCRTYLGEDLCKDFSVVRNTGYSLTLELSDGMPADTSSWRMKLENLNDRRRISVSSREVELVQGSGWHQIDVTGNMYDMNVLAEPECPEDLEKYKIDYRYEKNKLMVRSRYVGPDTASVFFNLHTWDRLARSRVVCRLSHPEGGYMDYQDNTSMYYHQAGNLYFPNNDHVVLTLPNGSSLTLDDKTYLMDKSVEHNNVVCQQRRARRLFYTKPNKKGGETTATISYGGKSSQVKLGPYFFPKLKYDNPYLKLTDERGNELDVRTFGLNGKDYSQYISFDKLPSCVSCTKSRPEQELLQHNSVVKLEFSSTEKNFTTPVTIICEVMGYDIKVSSTLSF